MNQKNELDQGANGLESYISGIPDKKISTVVESEELKFIKSCKEKVFKRFILENNKDEKGEKKAESYESISLTEIIMESWTGSRVYQFDSGLSQSSLSSADSNDKSDDNELIIEIQVKMLEFMGVPSRLVVIRNVNYIVE